MPLKKKLLFAALYALLFPLSQLLGAPFAGIGLLLSLPFVAGGWEAGMALRALVDSKWMYLGGAGLAIFAQLAAILLVLQGWDRLFQARRGKADA